MAKLNFKALAKVRLMAVREGHCYQRLLAIAVALISMRLEKARGNREYFLN
jgi:hypothetical protein